jgi:hypothetical protein
VVIAGARGGGKKEFQFSGRQTLFYTLHGVFGDTTPFSIWDLEIVFK